MTSDENKAYFERPKQNILNFRKYLVILILSEFRLDGVK